MHGSIISTWFIQMLGVRISFDLSYVMRLSISTLCPCFLWRIDTIFWLIEKAVWCPHFGKLIKPSTQISPHPTLY